MVQCIVDDSMASQRVLSACAHRCLVSNPSSPLLSDGWRVALASIPTSPSGYVHGVCLEEEGRAGPRDSEVSAEVEPPRASRQAGRQAGGGAFMRSRADREAGRSFLFFLFFNIHKNKKKGVCSIISL